VESLLYFLFWAVIFYFMMAKGCGVRAKGRNRDGKQQPSQTSGQTSGQTNGELYWQPPLKDLDPVCRKNIFTQNAKSSVYQGQVYYFCSRECREVFEAAPGIYLAEPKALATADKEHAHV